jgi:hypothetical protein
MKSKNTALQNPGLTRLHITRGTSRAIFPAIWEFSWRQLGNVTGTLAVTLDDVTPEHAEQSAAAFHTRLEELT